MQLVICNVYEECMCICVCGYAFVYMCYVLHVCNSLATRSMKQFFVSTIVNVTIENYRMVRVFS